jgi:nicotinate phosphoribosyltransferase
MLPEETRAIQDPTPCPVGVSARLEDLQRRIRHRVIAKELGES